MKILRYKFFVLFLFVSIISISSQKFEKGFSKEIKANGNTISLIANYADIEIIEWKKNKIKVDATMIVDGVSKEEAQSYFDSWKINLDEENDKIKIISKSKNHFPKFLNYDSDFNFENFDFEMPEISIESLGVLDSMNFSFPEINFSEVFNDSIFNNIYTYDFSFNADSLKGTFNNIDFKKLKENQKYLQEWQEANKENFIKLRNKAGELAKKNKLLHEKRMKLHQKQMKVHQKRMKVHQEKMKLHHKKKAEVYKKREKVAAKRLKLRNEIQKKRHDKIKNILKNRNKAKVRTKLIIRVPKGTDFDMNVNYSKISTN